MWSERIALWAGFIFKTNRYFLFSSVCVCWQDDHLCVKFFILNLSLSGDWLVSFKFQVIMPPKKQRRSARRAGKKQNAALEEASSSKTLDEKLAASSDEAGCVVEEGASVGDIYGADMEELEKKLQEARLVYAKLQKFGVKKPSKKKKKHKSLDIASLRSMDDVRSKVDKLMDKRMKNRKFSSSSESSSSSDSETESCSSSSDSSSSASDRFSESDEEEEKRRKKKKGKKKNKKSSKERKHRSGKTKKVTSYVKYPQEWPHTHLSLHFVNKSKKYEQLTVEEFCAGYTSILENVKRKVLPHRLSHLKDVMYLATRYRWESVLSFHAACLLEIERGHIKWGDNFQKLQSTTLAGGFLDESSSSQPQSSNVVRRHSSTNPEGPITFCKDYQRGVCREERDHVGELHGNQRYLRHICARCWLSNRRKASHPEISEDCPLYLQIQDSL